MEVLFILENELFNELVNLDLKEVGRVLNYFECFVPATRMDEFEEEAAKIQRGYDDEIKKIDEYESNEYEEIVKKGVAPKFEEEPSYLQGNIEAKYRDLLIKLIKKYFDSVTFINNKDRVIENEARVKEVKESVFDLTVSMTTVRRRLYSFLTVVGYYQRHSQYFLSRSDVYKICCKYSNEVCYINKSLGMTHQYYYIFGSWGRVDSDKYLDVDKISLQSLVLPYLKSNTLELSHIIEIIDHGFKKFFGEEAWEYIWDETKKFIRECELKGMMKVCR